MDRRAFGLSILAVAGCAATETRVASGPVDEGSWISINGVEQWVAVRGNDARNPLLLWLHGGPGIGMASSMELFTQDDFTVAIWDQAASGATGIRNIADQGELSLDRHARDGIAVVEHLRKRFGKRKIALIGVSWGTHLGIEMVHRRPDLFSAYVGTAQLTGRRGSKVGYEMALKACRERGNTAGVAALERVGPPPYEKFEDFLVRQQYTNPPGQPMSAVEAAKVAEQGRLLALRPLDAKYRAYPVRPPGFDGAKMFLDTQRIMQRSEWDWEIRDYGRDWPIPIFVFQGEHDFNAPEPLSREWLAEIKAPRKAYEVIAGAGHNTTVFNDELRVLVRKYVLPVAR